MVYNPYNQIANPQQQFDNFNQSYNNQFYNMINNGQFGQTMPINNIGNFNEYQNSMFQPLVENKINNNQYLYYQEPKFDYYNPWGTSNINQPQINLNPYEQPVMYNSMNYYGQQPMYNNMNPYGQSYYYDYRTNTYKPNNYYNRQNENSENVYDPLYGLRIVYEMTNDYLGKGWSDNDIENMINPKSKYNQQETMDQIIERREREYIRYVTNCPEPNEFNCSIIRNHKNAMNKFNEFHKNYDRHSLYEFMCKDLPQILYGFWLEDNLEKDNGRDLSMLYNSNDYNELLKLHRTQNPYMKELLDTSRYDNNLDDTTLGIELAFQRAKRKADLIEGRISSAEKMRRRELMTQEIINMMNAKEAMNNV